MRRRRVSADWCFTPAMQPAYPMERVGVRVRKVVKLFAWLIALGVLSLVGLFMLDGVQTPPRALGPYLERRALGHNPAIEGFGRRASQYLLAADRGNEAPFTGSLQFKPAVASAAPLAGGREKLVASSEEALRIIENAEPGDVITFLPGTYAFSGGRGRIAASRAGSPDKPISVRAQRPGTVQLHFSLVEGFKVSGAYWVFENLTIRGTCDQHRDCEHAFHIVGAAHHFTARNNTLIDFNAHFKINAENGAAPDDGLLEGNVLTNEAVRNTSHPVSPVDLVAASNWVVRGNVITDFIKGDGNQVSYGGFFKGAGENSRFEQNLVVCEYKLRGKSGARVGLSLGGGGTDAAVCRDKRCITEQTGGVIQSNVILACSDEGIYINKAAASIVRHNTLIDTGPLSVRYPESSADVEGNLVDSNIRSRDGGVLRKADNLETGMGSLYAGRHPVRDLFVNAPGLDLQWRAKPPRRAQAQEKLPDLCAPARPELPLAGAAEDYRCLGLK
jgi:hypothetical protein